MTAPQRQRLALLPAGVILVSSVLQPVPAKATRYKVIEALLTVTAVDAAQYDVFITTGDGNGAWDLFHFPQISGGGAQTWFMRANSDQIPVIVTPAGVATNDGPLEVGPGNTNFQGTLAAGATRHGPWGHLIGYRIVTGGTVVTGLACSIVISMRA